MRVCAHRRLRQSEQIRCTHLQNEDLSSWFFPLTFAQVCSQQITPELFGSWVLKCLWRCLWLHICETLPGPEPGGTTAVIFPGHFSTGRSADFGTSSFYMKKQMERALLRESNTFLTHRYFQQKSARGSKRSPGSSGSPQCDASHWRAVAIRKEVQGQQILVGEADVETHWVGRASQIFHATGSTKLLWTHKAFTGREAARRLCTTSLNKSSEHVRESNRRTAPGLWLAACSALAHPCFGAGESEVTWLWWDSQEGWHCMELEEMGRHLASVHQGWHHSLMGPQGVLCESSSFCASITEATVGVVPTDVTSQTKSLSSL